MTSDAPTAQTAPVMRIFSYLPNPRVWKATITARLCGLQIELRGAPPAELVDWLWDFDARPLSEQDKLHEAVSARTGRIGFTGKPLFKTDSFLAAHPYGTVPAAFSTDGLVGLFESNSMMRAVARMDRTNQGLYGNDLWETSRIDGFLDTTLAFARDTQRYLTSLRMGALSPHVHKDAADAATTYLAGIENALRTNGAFITGNGLTLADIAFFCELALCQNERQFRARFEHDGLPLLFDTQALAAYPLAASHFSALATRPAFSADAQAYLAAIP
jgi:glutathione S-transferase